eukprot:scaffold14723_cov282-Ochromonas_danica.AAC.3
MSWVKELWDLLLTEHQRPNERNSMELFHGIDCYLAWGAKPNRSSSDLSFLFEKKKKKKKSEVSVNDDPSYDR